MLNNKPISLQNNEDLFGVPEKYDYSKYKNLEGYDFDDELIEKFAPVAKKLNLSQSSVEMLMDIAYEMSKKQNEKFENDEKIKQLDCIKNYSRMFKEDSELPNQNSAEIQEYMKVADYAYNRFASPALKDILKDFGLIYHPEMIKMFYKIGELAQEDNLSYDAKPVVEDLTPAQILYGSRD